MNSQKSREKGCMGLLKGIKAEVGLKEGAAPKFCKSDQFPSLCRTVSNRWFRSRWKVERERTGGTEQLGSTHCGGEEGRWWLKGVCRLQSNDQRPPQDENIPTNNNHRGIRNTFTWGVILTFGPGKSLQVDGGQKRELNPSHYQHTMRHFSVLPPSI